MPRFSKDAPEVKASVKCLDAYLTCVVVPVVCVLGTLIVLAVFIPYMVRTRDAVEVDCTVVVVKETDDGCKLKANFTRPVFNSNKGQVQQAKTSYPNPDQWPQPSEEAIEAVCSKEKPVDRTCYWQETEYVQVNHRLNLDRPSPRREAMIVLFVFIALAVSCPIFLCVVDMCQASRQIDQARYNALREVENGEDSDETEKIAQFVREDHMRAVQEHYEGVEDSMTTQDRMYQNIWYSLFNMLEKEAIEYLRKNVITTSALTSLSPYLILGLPGVVIFDACERTHAAGRHDSIVLATGTVVTKINRPRRGYGVEVFFNMVVVVDMLHLLEPSQEELEYMRQRILFGFEPQRNKMKPPKSLLDKKVHVHGLSRRKLASRIAVEVFTVAAVLLDAPDYLQQYALLTSRVAEDFSNGSFDTAATSSVSKSSLSVSVSGEDEGSSSYSS